MILALCIYCGAMLFIFSYALVQLHLLYNYVKPVPPTSDLPMRQEDYPMVTIQLPVFNEKYVIERLIDHVCSISYPKENLEIQVLDDSTDESPEIALARISFWQDKGINIYMVKRPDRIGFKAGALKYGLERAKGELIAIFDADFLPPIDFLMKTVSAFQDPKVGVVQTRWEHINRQDSLLTKIQALALDAHFSIEQRGRNTYGAFINFNGTAGVWRKTCILDAGNWEADTLTEDLDLSYRAQLRGWKFIYLEEVGSPAELPPIMSAIKSQQYRWNKGGAEVAKKSIGNILRSSLPLSVKLHGIFHLLNSSVFVAVLLGGIASVPLVYGFTYHPEWGFLLNLGVLFLFMTVILTINYFIAFRKHGKGDLWQFLGLFPIFLSMSMGLALHNGMAVLEGFWGRKTPFIRTPKIGQTLWNQNKYLQDKIAPTTWLEILLGLFFGSAVVFGFWVEFYSFILFHSMLALGFLSIGLLTLFHSGFARPSR